MIKQGEPEPALVGPWTMGRDKKNPKPLDTAAFHTLVKTASKCCAATSSTARPVAPAMTVHGRRARRGDARHRARRRRPERGAQRPRCRGSFGWPGARRAGFRLDLASATAWVEGGFERPALSAAAGAWPGRSGQRLEQRHEFLRQLVARVEVDHRQRAVRAIP